MITTYSIRVNRIILMLVAAGSAVVGLVLFLSSEPDVRKDMPPESAGTPHLCPPRLSPPRFCPTRVPVASPPQVSETEPVLDSPTLSAAVQILTGEGFEKSGYNDYQAALRDLTRNLSPADIDALTAFLEIKADDRADMRAIAFNGVKNDVLDVLLRQEVLPEDIGPLLVRMYRDKSYDDMWRDYCVQFMATYYERRWPVQPDGNESTSDGGEESPERAAIEDACRDALMEKHSTIAGTALLGLESLSRSNPRFDREWIGKTAEAIVSDPASGEPACISALRVAASLGRAGVLPEARIIAQIGETPTLRMAAIATLGDLGLPDDAELLEALSSAGDDLEIRRIAALALSRLVERIARPSEANVHLKSQERSDA